MGRVRVGDHEINYRSWQTQGAPVVVLVHGLIVSSRYLVPLGNALSGDRTVFAPDLPGFGASSKPERPLDARELGEVLAGWMERMGIADATIVANSYGCEVTLEALRSSSALTGSVVLMGATVDSQARSSIVQCIRMLRSLHREPWWFVPCALRDFASCGLRASLAWIRDMARYDTIAAVASVDVPIAIVRGQHDVVAPRRWIDELSAATGTPAFVIAGAGHIAHGSKPDEIAAVVRSCAAPADEMSA